MKTVRVLQLGAIDFSKSMRVSDRVDWNYEPDLSKLTAEKFDAAILDREISAEEFQFLCRALRAYTLFVTESAALEEGKNILQLMVRKKGTQITAEELPILLEEDLPDYYSGSYGEKYRTNNLSVAQGFKGNIFWKGYEGVNLCGDFGNELTQIVFWRYDIPIEENQAIEYWLEYAKDAGVEILLEVSLLLFGYDSIPEFKNVWTFTEKELEDIVYVENKSGKPGRLFMSLKARGQGNLTVSALHGRHSRRGKGNFIPGGKRIVTSEREEFFYYFDPGNLKPPLNVYFSGYKTWESYEGYGIMKEMEHPFLLLTEMRLEGGAAYFGSEEYEHTIEQIIRNHIKELGFQNSDVILSGISMGAFGALYYGCSICPHTILLGKPLASFGDIAENERINRAGGFPTSLDILHKFCGSLSRDAAARLNSRFWDRFDRTDWSSTQFAVVYMVEDDYDETAYKRLQSHLKGGSVKIYGKGLHGRHNDNTAGVVNWFLSQYRRIIQDNFEDTGPEAGGQS